MAAIAAGCSVYGDEVLDASYAGGGGASLEGGSKGSGGTGGKVGPDASIAGSGGSTGGAGGNTGKGGSGGGRAGSGGSSATGGAGGTGGSGASGGVDAGDASGTGGATGGSGGTTGTGGAAGAGGTTGTDGSSTGGAAGATGGSGGDTGTGGATGGSGGTAGGTGGTGGSTGGTGGTGGTMDAAPEAPPPAGAVFAVGSFTKIAGTGAQIVPHTLGQTPQALILWTAGKTNETLSGGFYYGIGISDSSTSASVASSSSDAAAASVSTRRMAAKAITLVDPGEASLPKAEADRQSWSAANFQLNWSTNDGQPYVIHYIAIGGPQVQAKVVNWQAPSAAGQKAVTGVGFQPEAVMHLYAGAAFTATPPANANSAVIGIGAMDKTGAQWSIQAADANAQDPTIASRAQRTNAAIYMFTDTGSVGVTKEATFVSMNSSGFTLNFTTANGNASQIYSLALAGLKASVGNFNKVTAGAPVSQSVSTGFQPGAVLMTSYQMGPQASQLNEAHCSFGIGASDGVNDASSAVTAADSVTTTSVDGQDKTSKAFLKMNTPPLDAEADVTSFGATGFTLNWTTNDSIASQMCFIALGAP